jgi:hypothetical protein
VSRVHEEGIRGLEKQLEEENDPEKRKLIRKLLAEERAKLLAQSKD